VTCIFYPAAIAVLVWLPCPNEDILGEKGFSMDQNGYTLCTIDLFTDTAAILNLSPGHPITLDWFYYCDNAALSLQKNK